MSALKRFSSLCVAARTSALRTVPIAFAAADGPHQVRAGALSEPCTYAVLPQSEIVASNRRDLYPHALQPRSYSSDRERLKIAQIAHQPDPLRLLSSSLLAGDGPPTVWLHENGWVVLDGNARAMGLQKAYKHGRAAIYSAALRAVFPHDSSEGVLVRVVEMSEEKAALFARMCCWRGLPTTKESLCTTSA